MARIVQLFKICGVTGCCPHAEGVALYIPNNPAVVKSSWHWMRHSSSDANHDVPQAANGSRAGCEQSSLNATISLRAGAPLQNRSAALPYGHLIKGCPHAQGVTVVTLNSYPGRVHGLLVPEAISCCLQGSNSYINTLVSLARALICCASLLHQFLQHLLHVEPFPSPLQSLSKLKTSPLELILQPCPRCHSSFSPVFISKPDVSFLLPFLLASLFSRLTYQWAASEQQRWCILIAIYQLSMF